jgi:Delta7-sterol 5-desaturase
MAGYLIKWVIVRVAVDVWFYLAHRLLHTPSFYTSIHKRHHEHLHARTATNFHVTITDNFLQGPLPIALALIPLKVFAIDFNSPFEMQMCVVSLYWWFSATHAGKQLPIVSWCPYLSIFYRWFCPSFDDTSTTHHEKHHNVFIKVFPVSFFLSLSLSLSVAVFLIYMVLLPCHRTMEYHDGPMFCLAPAMILRC